MLAVREIILYLNSQNEVIGITTTIIRVILVCLLLVLIILGYGEQTEFRLNMKSKPQTPDPSNDQLFPATTFHCTPCDMNHLIQLLPSQSPELPYDLDSA